MLLGGSFNAKSGASRAAVPRYAQALCRHAPEKLDCPRGNVTAVESLGCCSEARLLQNRVLHMPIPGGRFFFLRNLGPTAGVHNSAIAPVQDPGSVVARSSCRCALLCLRCKLIFLSYLKPSRSHSLACFRLRCSSGSRFIAESERHLRIMQRTRRQAGPTARLSSPKKKLNWILCDYKVLMGPSS